MAQVNCIREMFFEKGMSYADIARTTGHDVKTVKKYIYMENFNQPPPETAEKRGSKLDKYKSKIDSWLEADKQERKKQRHTAKGVYERLKAIYSDDFDCSYRLVAAYVAGKKKVLYSTQDQFYMPLEHICGEAQVDFGEADFFEGNVRCTGHYLNVSFPQSNGGYLQLFKGENMQCLAEGLMNIFNHIGGVPNRLWFDNLSPAVKKILKNHGRELTDAFLRFKNHYGFEAAFCNAGKGNEKGHVENKVGYHRRNLLVPVPQVDELKAFNQKLLILCDQDMMRPHYSKKRLIKELFEDDRKALLPLPAVAFDESELRSVRTNSYAKFTLNGGKHTYSTAPKYANSELFVKLSVLSEQALEHAYEIEIKLKRTAKNGGTTAADNKIQVQDTCSWKNTIIARLEPISQWWSEGAGVLEPPPEQFTLPDLDLHAYTPDGKHVGMNYETGIFEMQIPGVIASGGFYNSSEWISVPEDSAAYFVISSRPTALFLEEHPDLPPENEEGLYALSVSYFDENLDGVGSSLEELTIAPGAEVFHLVEIRLMPDGNYQLEIREGLDLMSLEAWEAAVDNIPDELFINNPSQRKGALKNKLRAIFAKVKKKNYHGVINQIQNDLLKKLNADAKADWVKEPVLVEELGALTAMLKYKWR